MALSKHSHKIDDMKKISFKVLPKIACGPCNRSPLDLAKYKDKQSDFVF